MTVVLRLVHVGYFGIQTAMSPHWPLLPGTPTSINMSSTPSKSIFTTVGYRGETITQQDTCYFKPYSSARISQLVGDLGTIKD